MIIIKNTLISIDSEFSYLKKLLPMVMLSTVIALVFSDGIKSALSGKFLEYINSEWFNQGDPIFNRDVGYYVFQRPFMMEIINVVSKLMLGYAAFVAAAYIVLYAGFDFYSLKNLLRERGVVLHVIISLMLYFVVKAVSFRFMAEEVLYNQNSSFTGAGYADINVWVPFYNIAPYLMVALVVAATFFALRKRVKHAMAAVIAYPALWLITALIASVVQGLVVTPNELAAESPYISNSIEFTRKAYNINEMTEKEMNVSYDLTKADIENNADTIDNIRIIDYDQTLKVCNQNQVIKPYYSFDDADIVTYDLDGKKTAVYISARELDTEKLEDSAKNYINMRMKYTHGTGVVMNTINTVTEEGLPYSVIRDIPSRSVGGAPEVTQPRIYFGQKTNDYVIVGTRDGEIDDIEQAYSYSGEAGIRMTLPNRLLYSAINGDFKMLISNQITSDSRLLINRNVLERVSLAAPFLQVDRDPSIIIDGEGRLKWIVDCYTTTDKYPYAERMGSFNYIRNSVKAVVDAYDGSVRLYVMDKTDPIIKAYQKIYPAIFESGGLPDDIAGHIRYPEYLFRIQADVLKSYHLTDASAFYQKKGVWAIAKEKYENDDSREVAPYYNLMKTGFSTDDEAELVIMIPFTPVGKDNMVSWVAARCEADSYGQLVCYSFPANESIYGTAQVDSNIDADAAISADMTLWSQGGSNVIRGNMLVIPIENSLLYVEPVYISSTGDAAIPLVKRVIVGYGDKVVMSETLNEALSNLFGVQRESTVVEEPDINGAIANTVDAYNKWSEAMKNGNWADMGEYQQSLENAVNRLSEYISE